MLGRIPRGIRRITFGTEPLPTQHYWTLDNITVAAAPGKKAGKP